MKKKGTPNIPREIILNLMICTGGILGFILLAIYPYQRYLVSLDTDIKTIEAQIEEQEILNPIYHKLLKQISLKEGRVLPNPQKGKLESDKVAEISSVFEEKARSSHTDLISVVPDITSLVEAPEHLSVSAMLRGSFFDFRNFFIQINKLPYLEHIEEIQIQPAAGTKEMRVKVWLALDR
jgi:hypothetical protein